MDDELGESLAIGVGVIQGCLMSPGLFNISINYFTWETKAKVEMLVQD